MASKILVVDDDKATRMTLKFILEGAGYEVDTAKDGVDAGIKIADFKPNLVTMDIMMPEMDGYKATRYLMAGRERTGQNVKVIVITALLSEGLINDLGKMGVKYMKKPVDSRVLIEMIKEELS